jgi:3-isopropylmalate/(R)-2-methylmalate dehydratase small subunit
MAAMKEFTLVEGLAAPLPQENIDTDKIIAARFLKTITREGLGKGLFYSLRQDPQFVLNREPWSTSATILVALDNFGCGSSREHAPWALLDFGFRCIVAPSFADIFYNNCFKNGILPIVQPRETVLKMLELSSDALTASMKVDLATQQITLSDGSLISFDIDPQRKTDLLQGIDEIARTLLFECDISRHEELAARNSPWLGPVGRSAIESLG